MCRPVDVLSVRIQIIWKENLKCLSIFSTFGRQPNEIGPNDRVHPKGQDVFDRTDLKSKFELRCLPYSFFGPLRSAKIVLLYLSPGFDEFDLKEAESLKGRERMVESRSGKLDLPNREEHEGTWRWWKSRTKDFGRCDEVQSKIAVLNIGAYHSKQGPNDQILASLPSSRVSLEWAQTVLFPEAIAGNRIVICFRSAKFWGLDVGSEGRQFGKALFVPLVTRGGHMMNKPLKTSIVNKVRTALNTE